MPHYPSNFSAEEYDELRRIVTEVGEDGPFTASAVLNAYVGARESAADPRPVNAGSVAQILDDLADLDVIVALGGEPPQWRLP